MKRRGVEPTRITLGCMVEALAANDDPEGAYEVIQGALADPNTKGAGPCGQRRMMFGRPIGVWRFTMIEK